MQEVRDDAQRRFHVVPDEEMKICEITQIPNQVLLCVLRCPLVSMKLAPALSPCSTVKKRSRAWCTRLSAHHRETCKSVIEALIMANVVHEEDVSSHKVGQHCRVLGGQGVHIMENLE